jgi:hypothetical protein
MGADFERKKSWTNRIVVFLVSIYYNRTETAVSLSSAPIKIDTCCSYILYLPCIFSNAPIWECNVAVYIYWYLFINIVSLVWYCGVEGGELPAAVTLSRLSKAQKTKSLCILSDVAAVFSYFLFLSFFLCRCSHRLVFSLLLLPEKLYPRCSFLFHGGISSVYIHTITPPTSRTCSVLFSPAASSSCYDFIGRSNSKGKKEQHYKALLALRTIRYTKSRLTRL